MPTLFRKKPAPVAAGASKTMPRRVGTPSAPVGPTYVVPGYPGAAASAGADDRAEMILQAAVAFARPMLEPRAVGDVDDAAAAGDQAFILE